MQFSYIVLCLPVRILILPLLVHLACDRGYRGHTIMFLILIELGFASAHLWRNIEAHWCRPLHTVLFAMAAALVEVHAPSLVVTCILLLSPILGAMTSRVLVR